MAMAVWYMILGVLNKAFRKMDVRTMDEGNFE